MKLLHLSDLHIGRRLNNVSLLEDQIYILNQTLDFIDEYSPDAVIVAGDVYDSANPSAEAVMALDSFITQTLFKCGRVFIISGNHDSPERLSFGSDILNKSGLYIGGTFRGHPTCVELSDKYGKICVHMLPFIKPAHIKAFYGENVESFEEAVGLALSKTKIDKDCRNILIAHQFVTASGACSLRSDSETKFVGGLDNIDFSIFDNYDYVALGHLHCNQKVGRDTVIYSGSPLKYSVSERFQRKAAVLVELEEKGKVSVERIPFEPLRDFRQIKGTLETLLKQQPSDDYISVILTDATRHHEPYKRLRAVYPNCLSVEYADDADTIGGMDHFASTSDILSKSHYEIFERFYNEMNGCGFSKAASVLLRDILDDIANGGV